MPCSIQLDNVSRRFGSELALDGITWSIEPGEVVGLVGPSGSGKTTLLRLVAGLDQCSSGQVLIDGKPAGQTRQRPVVGMVFQSLALWPHLSARQHVEYVLSKTPRARRSALAESLLAEARLSETAWDRRPAQLSGGEAQRLALARAMAGDPRLLLLDEPLAHVDTPLRAELIDLLRGVAAGGSRTTMYVTHSWSEAVALCTRIGVIDQGRLAQSGTPDELFWQPANSTVARLTGPVVALNSQWIADGKIHAAESNGSSSVWLAVENEHHLLRPQQLCPMDPAEQNRWCVEAVRPNNSGWLIDLRLADNAALLQLPWSYPATKGQQIGLQVSARMPARSASE